MEHWSVPPFRRFLSYATNLDRVLNLSIQGIDHLSGIVPLTEALLEYANILEPETKSEDQDDQLMRVRERAEFAKSEVEAGFPVLHSHTVVAIWGALEALVQDLVTTWLENVPDIMTKEPFSSVKIRLGEFERLEADGRLEYIVKQLSEDLRVSFKPGVARFEAQLGSVGLSGHLDDQLKRDLYELHQARNVIVHKAGLVDRQFVDRCPWMSLQPGEQLLITHAEYRKYSLVVRSYMNILMRRCLINRGISPDKAEEVLEQSAES